MRSFFGILLLIAVVVASVGLSSADISYTVLEYGTAITNAYSNDTNTTATIYFKAIMLASASFLSTDGADAVWASSVNPAPDSSSHEFASLARQHFSYLKLAELWVTDPQPNVTLYIRVDYSATFRIVMTAAEDINQNIKQPGMNGTVTIARGVPTVQHWFIAETVPTKQWFALDVCDNGHNHTIQSYNLILTVYPAQVSKLSSASSDCTGYLVREATAILSGNRTQYIAACPTILSVSEQDHDFIGQRYFISVTLDSPTYFADASYTLRSWVDMNHSDSSLFFPKTSLQISPLYIGADLAISFSRGQIFNGSYLPLLITTQIGQSRTCLFQKYGKKYPHLSWVSRAQGIWQNDALLLFGAKSYFSNPKRYGNQLAIMAELPNGVAWVYPSIYADPKSIPAVAIPFLSQLESPFGITAAVLAGVFVLSFILNVAQCCRRPHYGYEMVSVHDDQVPME